MTHKRLARQQLVAKQQAAGVDGRVQPFVSVQRERIGSVNSLEKVTLALVHKRRSAVGAINVKPQSEVSRYRCDLIKGIDSPRAYSPGAGDDAEWFEAGPQIFFDCFAQSIHIHSQPV